MQYITHYHYVSILCYGRDNYLIINLYNFIFPIIIWLHGIHSFISHGEIILKVFLKSDFNGHLPIQAGLDS